MKDVLSLLQFQIQFFQGMPAQIASRLLAAARPLIQIPATARTQSLAVFGTKRPLWKLKDNIFTHLLRQVHEVLTVQLFVKHELSHI